jgi:hypothetical protein
VFGTKNKIEEYDVKFKNNGKTGIEKGRRLTV